MGLWVRVAVVTVALLAVLVPGTARAHPFLVTAMPQPGARLQAAPASVRLRFTEPVVSGSGRVELRTGEDEKVPIGPHQLRDGGLVLEAPVPPVDDGVYIVSWGARSATDGHLEIGEFAFAVGTVGRLPALPSPGGGTGAWPETAASWASVTALLLGFGALASEGLVWSPVGRPPAVAIPRLPVGSLLGLAFGASLVQLFLVVRQGSEANGGAEAWAAALTSRAGLLTLAQVAFTGYGLWLLPVRWARPRAMLPLGLALGAAAVRGHPGTGPTGWWAAPANVLHLVSVAVWLGGLAHLTLASWRLRAAETRPMLVEGARRYARLALWLVVAALASGLAVAFSQLTTPSDLVATAYGRTLLAKVALVGGGLSFALVARTRALRSNPGLQIGLLGRLARSEGAFLLAAVAAASAMSNTAPPRSLVAAEQLLGPPPLERPVVRLAGLAGSLAVYLGAAPDQLQVRILEPSGDPSPDAAIEIAGRAPDGSVLGISPRACGAGCVTVTFPWQQGATTLAVSVSSKEWGEGTLRFEVPWPPGAEVPGLLGRVMEAMRAQPRITITERVSSGPGAVGENSFSLTGKQFVELELYAAGGVTDVRLIPAAAGKRALTFYIPGSSIWYLLEIDAQHRIRHETIVNPGHLTERKFTYPSGPP